MPELPRSQTASRSGKDGGSGAGQQIYLLSFFRCWRWWAWGPTLLVAKIDYLRHGDVCRESSEIEDGLNFYLRGLAHVLVKLNQDEFFNFGS